MQNELLFSGVLLQLTQDRLNNLRTQWKLAIKVRRQLEKSSLFYFYEGEDDKQFTSTPLLEARDREISLFCDLCDYLEWFDPFVGLWDLVLEEDKIYHRNYKYNKRARYKVEKLIEEDKQIEMKLYRA
jgi:hypothetical protein